MPETRQLLHSTAINYFLQSTGYNKPEPLKWDTPRTEVNIKKDCIESEKLRKKFEGDWVVNSDPDKGAC